MKMKSIMTRVLCLSLSLVMVLGLTACGNDAGTTSSKKAELLSMEVRPDAPEEIPDGLDIDGTIATPTPSLSLSSPR